MFTRVSPAKKIAKCKNSKPMDVAKTVSLMLCINDCTGLSAITLLAFDTLKPSG